jgi:hypothetical protein
MVVIYKQVSRCILWSTDGYLHFSVEMTESNAKIHPLFARDKVEHVGGRNHPML